MLLDFSLLTMLWMRNLPRYRSDNYRSILEVDMATRYWRVHGARSKGSATLYGEMQGNERLRPLWSVAIKAARNFVST